MSDNRLNNLGVLVEKLGGPSRAARLFGYNAPSFLSQMLKGDRPVTEKTARRMERLIGLPEGWLDIWETPEALTQDLAERMTVEFVNKFLEDDKLPLGVTFAEYRQNLIDARAEEHSEPEDWPEYGRKVPLRYPSGRRLDLGDRPAKRFEQGPVQLLPDVGVRYGPNNEGKSGAVTAFMRWSETAASMVKEMLDAHEELHIEEHKIPMVVLTIAEVLRVTEGKMSSETLKNIIWLSGTLSK